MAETRVMMIYVLTDIRVLAIALTVFPPTCITELIATSTRHMVTAIALLNPAQALTALLCSNALSPIFKQLILLRLPLISIDSLTQFLLTYFLCFLSFFAGLLMMVEFAAIKAIFFAAYWAKPVWLIRIALLKHVIAVLRWTFLHAWVLHEYFLPFEPLTSFKLLS